MQARTSRFIQFAVFALLLVIGGAGMLPIVTGQNRSSTLPIYQGKPDMPAVALACNVFWGEEHLPAILKACHAENVTITFFIGGSWAKRFPDALQQIAAAGHELGNHSYSHPHPNTLTFEQNQMQIKQAEELVQTITGKQTRLYAPPYGEFNTIVLDAAQQLGYQTILWTIDTIDWQKPPVKLILDRVIPKLQNGAIILIHPTANTATALPLLLQQIKQRGYQIKPVSELL